MSALPCRSGYLAAMTLALLGAGCDDRGSPDPPLLRVTEIESPAAAGSAEPNLSVDADGGVYLSWLEPADSGHALRFAVLSGTRWSRAKTVASGPNWFVNWADFPSLLPVGGDRLVAHYLVRDAGAAKGYEYGVRLVQSLDRGATWSTPVTPHRDGAAVEHGFVSLFPLPDDSIGLIWLDGRSGDPRFGGKHRMALRTTTLRRDGGLGEDRSLDDLVCDCCQTAVARAAAGPIAVYRDRTEGEIRDIHTVRLVNGAWTAPVPVHQDGWKINACPVNGPSVSAVQQDVAVAWFTAAGDSARVLVAFSDDSGASFGAPIRVDGGNPTGRVDVEMLGERRALVSWVENNETGGAEVRARLVSPDAVLGAPTRIAASSAERASGFPRMAREGDGVVLAWTEPGNPTRVRVARAQLEGGR